MNGRRRSPSSTSRRRSIEFCRTLAGPARVRRRRRGQPHAARTGVWRSRHRNLRLWRIGRGFPARQHIEASRAIARRHRLDPEHTIFAEQSEKAIAAGAFHNDVVAVANERVLFAHELAFADKAALIAQCERLVPGFEYVEVSDADVPLADAVRSYLFNGQLVTAPDDEMVLLVPGEARDTPSVWRWIERHVAGNARSAAPRWSTCANRWPTAVGRRACVCGWLPIRRRSTRGSWSTTPGSTGSPMWCDATAEQIHNQELQEPALIQDIESARAALLEALDLDSCSKVN